MSYCSTGVQVLKYMGVYPSNYIDGFDIQLSPYWDMVKDVQESHFWPTYQLRYQTEEYVYLVTKPKHHHEHPCCCRPNICRGRGIFHQYPVSRVTNYSWMNVTTATAATFLSGISSCAFWSHVAHTKPSTFNWRKSECLKMEKYTNLSIWKDKSKISVFIYWHTLQTPYLVMTCR